MKVKVRVCVFVTIVFVSSLTKEGEHFPSPVPAEKPHANINFAIIRMKIASS